MEIEIEEIKTRIKEEGEFDDDDIETFIDHGSVDDFNTVVDKDGNTVLMYVINYDAGDNRDRGFFKKLIELGVDVNKKNNKDQTALMKITAPLTFRNSDTFGNILYMASLVIENGAFVNTQDSEGATPLMMACGKSRAFEYNTDIREGLVGIVLRAEGVNVDIQDQSGNSALMYSSGTTDLNLSDKIVKLLLEKNANVNLQSGTGATALMMAAIGDNSAIVGALIKGGANVELKTDSGHTVFELLDGHDTGKEMIGLIKSLVLERDSSPTIPNELFNKLIRVNITKTVSFQDAITMDEEEININDYLETKGNIVIVYNNNSYFFTTRDVINKQRGDATLFPCKVGDTMRPENIIKTKPLYDLKKIGFVYGYPCVMDKLFENPDAQLFGIVTTEESYPSFVTQNILNQVEDYVSGLHCQAGQESKISVMVIATPSMKDNDETTVGGRNKRMTLKHKKLKRKFITCKKTKRGRRKMKKGKRTAK